MVQPPEREGLTRRQFAQNSAAWGATLAGLSLSRSAHAAGSDVIRVGVIGCGGRGAGAAMDAMNADPGVRVVAMSDLFMERVQGRRNALASQKPDQMQVDDDHCFIGMDAYLNVIDAADVVLIACAAKFHPMYLLAGIEAGKHVFVEKPPAIDPLGIQVVNQATELAAENTLGILTGLQSRFHPAIRATMQEIHEGRIGQITSIEENFLRGPYGQTSRPENMRELEIQYGNQYRFSWLSGDDVTQSLVHNLDRATWALKETPPVRCHGLGGRSSSERLLGDVFDHHSVIYHYADGTRLYAFCRTTIGCYNENSSMIVGTKGTAYPLAGRISGENEWRYTGPGDNPYVVEHREFLQSIRAGEPMNCGEFMSRSTLVSIMGQLSCYSGRAIRWEEITPSDYCLGPRPEDCTWDMDPPTVPDEDGIYPVVAIPGMTTNV